MNDEPGQEFTEIEELAKIPLSELVEPQDLELPQIEAQDLELPQDYLQDLTDRGVITEGLPVIDSDSRLLEGPELEQSPFHEPSIERDDRSTREISILDGEFVENESSRAGTKPTR